MILQILHLVRAPHCRNGGDITVNFGVYDIDKGIVLNRVFAFFRGGGAERLELDNTVEKCVCDACGAGGGDDDLFIFCYSFFKFFS